MSLLEAATNFVDDYDDTGCDGCGVVSETSWQKLRNAMKAAQAGTSENPKLLTAASRAVDDYETEGCEDCGMVSEGAYKALRDIVSKLSKR